MILSRTNAAVLLAVLAGAAVAAFSVWAQQGQIPMPAQQPSAPASSPASAMNRNLVVLDPAHGGADAGGTLAGGAVEKDVTLAMAGRLRTALTAAGFTVVTTRDADVSDPLTTDQRAEIANRTHAVACIVLHATAIGSGVHVYTSTLPAAAPEDAGAPLAFAPVLWDLAQAGSVAQSLQLASDLKAALGGGNLPVVAGRAAVRPLDNLMCPAVAIEMAPLQVPEGSTTPVTDAAYQKRVADTVTAALQTWRNHADAGAAEVNPDGPTSAQAKAIAAAEAEGIAAARAMAKSVPQGLKPDCKQGGYGTDKSVPLSKADSSAACEAAGTAAARAQSAAVSRPAQKGPQ